LRYTR